MAAALAYIQDNNLTDYEQLAKKATEAEMCIRDREDDKGGPQDTGKAQEPEGSAEKAGSKKDKYQKAQAKAERAGEKLGKAREKLDKVEAKRAAQKPPGLAKRCV